MSAGYRSLLAFWLGGAAKPTTTPVAEYRPRFMLLRKRIPNSPGTAPIDGVPLRLRKAEN